MDELVIEKIAEKAAKAAVKEMALERDREARNRVFQNTKLLMEHYNSIKEHVSNGVSEISELEGDCDFVNPADELFVESVRRSKTRSLIMVTHIDRSLELLKEEQERRNTPEKYMVLRYTYIDGMTQEDIAEVFGYSDRTIRRYVKEMLEMLSVFLFGIDGLKL